MPAAADEPRPCRLGFVFALGIESGCFEDLLRGVVTIRGGGFCIREGGLHGRRMALILSGAGRQNAARAVETLLDGHRPQRIVSAGLAGGICPTLKRGDILVADRLLTTDGGEMPVELPDALTRALAASNVHRGALLTSDRVARSPEQREALHQKYGALAVDMETYAVAEVCRRRGTPFSAVRAINDTAGETLMPDVERLLAQKTGAARLGAALAAVWRRPASAKEMYQLRENALVASLALAKFLSDCEFG